jgi:hypothetical protein
MESNQYSRYLGIKHGSGVGAFAAEGGGHTTSRTVLDLYSVQGKPVPADVQAALSELNALADGEAQIARSTEGERRMLAATNNYDPVAISRRNRELMAFVQERTRDVANAENRIAFQAAQANLRAANARANDTEAATAHNAQLRPIQLQKAQISLRSAQVAAGQLAETAAYDARIDEMVAGLETVPTGDLLAAARTRDPVQIAAVFGDGVRPTEAYAILDKRLQSEQGSAAAMDQAEIAAELVAAEKIASEYTLNEINGMLDGSVAAPEGADIDITLAAKKLATQRIVASQALDAQIAAGEIETAQSRSALLDLKLRSMPLAKLQELLVAATGVSRKGERNPNTGPSAIFEFDGLNVSFTGSEIVAAMGPIKRELEEQRQIAAANNQRRLITEAYLEGADEITQNITGQLGYVPTTVRNMVDIESAGVRTHIAAGNFDKAAKAAGDLRGAIEAALEQEGVDKEQIAVIMSGKLGTAQQYQQGVTDFVATPSLNSSFSPFMQAVQSRLTAQIGDELNPHNRSRFNEDLLAKGDVDAFDNFGMSVNDYVRAFNDTYIMEKVARAAQLMADPTFLGESVPPVIAEQANEIFAQAVSGAQADDQVLNMAELLNGLHTLSYANGLGDTLMVKFQDAVQRVDLSGFFQNSTGMTAAEAAAINLYGQLVGGAGGFGPNSIARNDAPQALVQMLDRQINNSMIGQNNMGTPLGVRHISYLMAQIFPETGRRSLSLGGYGMGSSVNGPGNFEDYSQTHPEATALVAKLVAAHELRLSHYGPTHTLFGLALSTPSYSNAGAEAFGLGVEEVREALKQAGLAIEE